ncbi:hotdog domain-containing protein [Psychrobacter sp. CAL346-MNA-CIBAN-0220]|uniref:hotdog domain-containing protein n=1 Tax=Psychrobacter sp. CAL346-MNA-CIBAN-0220 TaxID=3140457 RepID=UPI0033215FAF
MTTSTSNTAITPLFSTDYHIYINHTDAGGIVYHANHLIFFENCRRDWFTKLGLNGYFLQTDDGQVQHFVVSQAQLQYRKAIFLDEIINVRIDKVELKPASIVFYQSIHRHLPPEVNQKDTKSLDTLLSSTKIVIACVKNLINSDQPSTPLENSSDAPIPVASATPIRPIRVPKKLHDMIQQAVTQHTDE